MEGKRAKSDKKVVAKSKANTNAAKKQKDAKSKSKTPAASKRQSKAGEKAPKSSR